MGTHARPIVPLTDAERAKVEAAMPLLNDIAAGMHRNLPRRVEFGDLLQWGTFGMVAAVRGFEESRGIAFSTYATPRVRGAILDGIRSADWVPRLARKKARHGGPKPVEQFSLSRKWFETDSGRDVNEAHMTPDPKAALAAEEPDRRDLFKRLTRGMRRTDRLIVELLYLAGLTMDEVSAVVGVSAPRISQMHKRITQNLKARVLAGELPELAAA